MAFTGRLGGVSGEPLEVEVAGDPTPVDVPLEERLKARLGPLRLRGRYL